MNKSKLVFMFVLSLSLFSCGSMVQKVVENQIEDQMGRINYDMLNDGKMHVVLVGTGGPVYNTDRLPSCTAIIAGGEFILVDLGPGTVRNADLQNLPMENLSAVFLTHFHSDHISDLGECNFWSAAMGRSKTLEVFGPEGVEDIVNGYNLAFKHDTSYRIAHHGEDVFPDGALTSIPKTVLLKKDDEAELFFDRNGLKAYAFLVDHHPVTPAYGYRFEYKGNVVVLSGDTIMIENLTKHAKDADIFVCEALSKDLVKRTSEYAKKTNRPRIAKMTSDILDYHMSPVEAGKTAKEANAKKLVLNHIVPPILNFAAKRMFLRGVDDVYDGEIVLGEDGMHFALDPKK